ncbi:HAD-IA family hydrolase (plasmid) [Priestia filamentosa]|nr:HAD-IA family hydrolase [Priestia filamentosa]
MIKAVIFDLDDTLISEKEYIKSGYQHIAALLNAKGLGEIEELVDKLLRLLDENSKNVFNRLFDFLEVTYTRGTIMELVDEYRNHLPSVNFYEDVLPCIYKLKKMDIKLGIITDGYANAQRQKLRRLVATRYFDEIVVTDEIGTEYWKPHPKSFEIMKEKLGVKYDEMIYVGDNPQKDFYISSIYPIKTIRIHRQGLYKHGNYRDGIKEHYSIKDLNEFSILLSNWN